MAITSDAFSLKPFYLPPECNGEVKITASITDLTDIKLTYDKEKNTAVSAYINFVTIEIGASSTVEIEFDATGALNLPDTIIQGECDLSNLNFIPAFHSGGTVKIQSLFKGETSKQDIDVTVDLQVKFDGDFPTWYPSSLVSGYDSFINLSMITSGATQRHVPQLSKNSSFNLYYNISSWDGLPPFLVKMYDPPTDGADSIKRAVLAPPTFKLILTNAVAKICYLTGVLIEFTFNVSDNGLLMDIRGSTAQRRTCKLFVLPRGTERESVPEINNLYAVAEGYLSSTTDPNSGYAIKHMFAFYNKKIGNTDSYYQKCVELTAVSEEGSNHSPLVWAVENEISLYDFNRMAYNGFESSDIAKAITPITIASEENYRVIEVTTKDNKSISDPNCIFLVTVKPNVYIDDKLSMSDFTNNIDKIRFFNVEKDFATSSPEEDIPSYLESLNEDTDPNDSTESVTIEVPRSEISPIFYETLHKTYQDATVLQSVGNEPLYFIEFTVNEFATAMTIYHNQTLEFSDFLNYASDGIRSGDIFYLSNVKPNTINITDSDQRRYNVKFHVDYNVYKDIYIYNEEDFEEQ